MRHVLRSVSCLAVGPLLAGGHAEGAGISHATCKTTSCSRPAHGLEEESDAVELMQRGVLISTDAGAASDLQPQSQLREQVQEILREPLAPPGPSGPSEPQVEQRPLAGLWTRGLAEHWTRGGDYLRSWVGAEKSPPQPKTTAVPGSLGVSFNSDGDLKSFVDSTAMNTVAFFALLLIFSKLRVHYPLVYANRERSTTDKGSHNPQGSAPGANDVSKHFSWVSAGLSSTLQENIDAVGLDNAMLIRFSELAIKICIIVGLPTLVVEGPTNWVFGGMEAGRDYMSYLSMGNVMHGSHLYWFHAGVVWVQVLAVVHMLYLAQEEFVRHRWTWLRRMPALRANTVLVSGVPEEYQSDAKLRQFFEIIFPGGRIKSTYCVKDTSVLSTVLSNLEDARAHLHECEVLRAQGAPRGPLARVSLFNRHTTEHYADLVAQLEPKVKEQRRKISEASSQPGLSGYNCPTGFVTFNERSDAEVALHLDTISKDANDWIIESPPEASDILWADLMQDPNAEGVRTVIGYALVIGLYFAYVPLVLGITNIAKLINLGPMQSVWAGVAPTLGLTVMVSMLPTFLIWIFKLFFTLKAEAWSQHRLQSWYFWFQIIFVVMATAVGQNVRGFTETVVQSPWSLFGTLADTLPYATHFYMNYIVMQWVTHSTNILRYMNLIKYKMFCLVYDEETAAGKAEPEDQDYYGLGSRSARWAANMVLLLVFGTLCPPIWLLGLINFVICRICYGYLILCAETRKPDLGGVFWVNSLKHLFFGLVIYVVLMTGVLVRRSAHGGPALAVIPAIPYLFLQLRRWETFHVWEKLPFHELMMAAAGAAQDGDAISKVGSLAATYVQKELIES